MAAKGTHAPTAYPRTYPNRNFTDYSRSVSDLVGRLLLGTAYETIGKLTDRKPRCANSCNRDRIAYTTKRKVGRNRVR